MNDFEDKLRSRTFRPPPAHIRRAVLTRAERAIPGSPWKEWLWPSPLAWGGLTAILIAAFIFNAQLSAPRVPAAAARAIQAEPPQPGLYALFQGRPTPPWADENLENPR